MFYSKRDEVVQCIFSRLCQDRCLINVPFFHDRVYYELQLIADILRIVDTRRGRRLLKTVEKMIEQGKNGGEIHIPREDFL